MRILLALWKRQTLFIRLIITLMASMLIVVGVNLILEGCRQSRVFNLGWGDKPNDEIIVLRSISLNFINICSIYSYYFLKECESKKIKFKAAVVIWYVVISSWIALAINYFKVDNSVPIEEIKTLVGISSIILTIYWIYVFAYLYNNVRLRLENEERLSKEFLKQAITDNLTGLKNRLAFAEDLLKALENCKNENKKLSVLFLDLDRFKYINDTLGHNTGDFLLQRVSKLLMGFKNENRDIYRLGGDEFTIITLNSQEDVNLSEEIIRSFEDPISIEEKEIYITTSIGIARYPEAGEDVETLTKNADSAMYMAKDQGKNRFWIYTKNIHHKLSEMVDLENDLRRAINEDQFFLNFQPIIDIGKNIITSFEVFIRWRHPNKGLIMPGAFIPLAEETGLIVPIGEWVLKNACIEYNNWIKPYSNNIKLAVNLSARQLQQSKLVSVIENILKETNFDAKNLELEVTESGIMRNPEQSIERLRLLRDKGISIIIDDFGIEYSSLNYLKLLPNNTLKIDKSFIDGILINRSDATITKAMIELGHSLSIVVIAEGVETIEQYETLKSLGCDRIQGYYFSRPVEVDKLPKLILKNVKKNR